jgi:uncharacterized protein YjeT (DUF2065 family)
VSTDTLLGALGLVLILEGLMPFLSPGGWRRMFAQIAEMRDGQIRFMGLIAIAIGLLLISFI